MTEMSSASSIKMRNGIRWKLMLAMVSMILAMVTLLTLVQVDAQQKNLMKALSTHSTFLQEDVIKRANKAATHMSGHIQERIVVFDYEALQQFIRDAVKDVEELEYVILMRSVTPVVAYGQDLNNDVRQKILSGKASSFAENQMKTTRYEFEVGEHKFMETIVPIYLNEKVKWGSLRLGFSLDELNRTLAESQLYVNEEIRKMVYRSVITAILFLIVGAVAVFFLASRWTRPLHDLLQFSNKLAAGDFNATPHLSTRTSDEIGVLVSSLEEMAGSLKQTHDQLEDYNHTLEHNVEQRTRELAQARDRAVSADKSKSEFLANMSHEIRTPINAVIGLTHLALDREHDKLQRDYLTKTLKASESLLSIINDILDFSKIEADKLDLDLIDFDMDEVMHNLSGIAGVRASEKGLDFLIDCPTCMPRLKGDPYRLGQILLNLVNNAIKFTRDGQIVVSTRVEKRGADHFVLRFDVTDTGIGLNEEQRSNLFQAFSQADSSITRRFGGTGLGLAICKQLVEMMGGEIGLESEEGEGSTFFFTAVFGIGQECLRAEQGLPEKLQGMQVLIVDDNEDSKSIFSKYLNSYGFSVILASTVDEAAAQLLSEERVDVMLVDWTLADMKGLDSVKRIQQAAGLGIMPPSILAANYGQVVSDEKAEAAGISARLFKPVTSASILQAIYSLFNLVEADNQAGKLPVERIAHLQGARLLLVEDNDINQLVAEGLLSKAGISLSIAHNGLEAVQQVAQESFDGVLMDMQMPVMDGLEATRLIRRDMDANALPIIAMTANAMPSDVKSCMQAGMNDHVAKPIDPLDLYTKLDRWISNSRLDGVEAGHLPELQSSGVDIPELAGIDTEGGLKRIGGDTSLYQKVLYKFAGSQQQSAARVYGLFQEGNREESLSLIHSLKGVAGNIGAETLCAVASELELQIKHGETLDESLFLRLETELSTVINAIAQWRDQTRDVVEAAEKVDPAAVAGMLAKMREMLEAYDGDAVDLIDDIEKAVSAAGLSAEVEEMRRYLNQYDFDAALQVLEAIETKLKVSS